MQRCDACGIMHWYRCCAALQSATGIICNITSRQVGLGEVHHIGEIISPMAGPGCSIKYGAVNDSTFEEGELQVTLM